jgi:hypothetical protein
MKIISVYFSLLFVLLSASSCIEHEVIPPPTNTLDLNASFVGYVNGTQVEFTQNVLNYKGYSDNFTSIYASPLLSKMLFISEMKSPTDQRAIRMTFGSLDWDASANSTPTLTMFNDFHTNNSGINLPFQDWVFKLNIPIKLVLFGFQENQIQDKLLTLLSLIKQLIKLEIILYLK